VVSDKSKTCATTTKDVFPSGLSTYLLGFAQFMLKMGDYLESTRDQNELISINLMEYRPEILVRGSRND